MSFVDYERRGKVALITLNRPKRLNAFGAELADGVRECFVRFHADDKVNAAVLR
ncbi:MAG: enoyl-CoA hydratase-related protein, partial [Dehalococcoidia bacterium]|nr:enoyl-CoA hydratase-related protein [Dehalococcoidia bacterium]